jgi:hypothetical protein
VEVGQGAIDVAPTNIHRLKPAPLMRLQPFV